MIYLYNFILAVFFVPAVILLLIRHRKRVDGAFIGSLGERLGIWNEEVFRAGDRSGDRPLLWVHCASLGEVKAVEPLLRKLGKFTLLMTTITSSGREYARKNRLADRICYAPLDFSFIAGRLMARVNPRAFLLVETELWPGLIHAAGCAGVPVLLINARLSKRSYPYYRALASFWRPVVGGITRIGARYREDADRFAGIGYPPARVTITGNVKYDQDFPLIRSSKEYFGFASGDRVWVCGSTREGEETVIFEAWDSIRVRHPELKLVIAPRHINRAGALAAVLAKRGEAFARRSKGAAGAFDCLLVDTFGELAAFYAFADVAFVGGSLVAKGGQNPIEPAAYAKPVLFGPSMDNFAPEARLLEESKGAFRVRNAGEIAAVVERLLADDAFRGETGRKALLAVQSQRGALDRTLQLISSLVSPPA